MVRRELTALLGRCFREAKERGERLTMLTAYDYPTARIFDDAGIDLLLVGDSIGNTMQGRDTTIPVPPSTPS